MKIRRIELTNFKRHRSLAVNIAPGLIGLVGSNGSGKSSFLSSMAYAITGTPLGDEPVKDLVTWGEKSGCVEMEFEHGGHVYNLRRPVGKTNTSLDGDDGTSIKGTAPVNAEMQRMSGTPFDLFKGIMFVAQDALDAPLKGTEAARKEAFGKLFNCQRYERLRDILQEGVARVAPRCRVDDGRPMQELEKELGTARASLQANTASLDDLGKQMAQFDLPALYRTVNSIIRDEQAIADALSKRDGIGEELKKFSEKEAEELEKLDVNTVVQRMQYLDSIIRYVDTGVCPMCGHRDGKPPMDKETALKEKESLASLKARYDEYRRLSKDWWDASNLYDRLTSATVTREQADDARRDIARRETLEQERLRLKANEGWLEGRIKAVTDQMAEKKRIAEEASRATQVLQDLEAVRNAFHRDAVQKAVRAYGASQINDRLLGYLSLFNLPYKPSFDDDGLMRFTDTQSGTTHEFSKLSGGQQKLTALAYRLALMQMFAGNVRVAILDEPTYGVDRQNLEMMGESFRALSEYAGQRGLSIFVATHEEALFPAFDQVIEL